MAAFAIRFLICNIFISIIIGILLFTKQLFKNILSSRMQYNLWLFLLALLIVPFLPFRLTGYFQIFSWLEQWKNISAPNTESITTKIPTFYSSDTANWMNDFSLSVSRETPSFVGFILWGAWIAGILVMITLITKSKIHLNTFKKSALPLQNPKVRKLYNNCLNEMKITTDIPIHSTAFLKSPIIVGFLKPCIYLPIHLISDYNAADMRYILLHELQHYKHKDALTNYLMNLAGILYWFNPVVWYALKEMHDDREIACDISVLKMLEECDYENYGSTLINFAEKVSFSPFPFSIGVSGNIKQMKRRILKIASYQKPSILKRIKGISAFGMTVILLFGIAPALSTYASDSNRYEWNFSTKNISYLDFSAYFNQYEGSFVLYDLERNSWNVYDMEHAITRVSPNSTYKIYSALFGLEEGIITPEDSLIAWNKEIYPYEAWNADQNLHSAMDSSVNWYFQTIDKRIGVATIYNYIKKLGYGNENVSGKLSSYWMESSLKISPIEQVELLTRIYNNSPDFSPENINTVKDSICLSSSENGTFYGKTGTGRVNGQDVNGWFIGCVETADNTYFFATNIRAVGNAAGSNATEITMSILSDMNIWK